MYSIVIGRHHDSFGGQDAAVEREIRDIRMRYTRERDMRNSQPSPRSQPVRPGYIPVALYDGMGRIFGRRHVTSMFWLVVAVLALALLRLLVGSPLLLLGRLPADLRLQGQNWEFFAPIGTCLLLSGLLSLLSRLAFGANIDMNTGRVGADNPPYPPSGAREARGGFQFHGSVVICAIQ